MSQQNEGQHTEDASGKKTDSTNTVTKSPEELAKIAEDQKKRAEKAETEAKEAKTIAEKATAEANELRAQLEKAGDSKGDVSDADIAKIAEEFDVDPKFAEALAKAISTKNEAKIKEAKDELQGALKKKEAEDATKAFNEAFDKAFTKATEDIEVTVDKEAVKTVFLQRVKDNQELTVTDVISQMYGGATGKKSSEDDVRGGGEGNGTAIDFETAHRDPKKLQAIMADPQAKAKYYAWRDKQNI